MRLSYADAIAQAATRCERAHQRFLRTLKMLQEWRRSTTTVYVGSAAQINVGQQQVNVAAPPGGRGERREDLPKSSGARRTRAQRSPVSTTTEKE